MSDELNMVGAPSLDEAVAHVSANAVAIHQRSGPIKADRSQPIKVFGITLPEPAAQLCYSVSDWASASRYHTIRALPAFVVNNSSNFIGAAHVYTEGIMFKASLKGGKLVDHASNPIDYVIKASSRIYGEAFTSAFKHGGGHVNVMKGNPVKNIYDFVTDTKAATQREILAQNVHPSKVSLGNPWQTRATIGNLIGWTFAAIVPERKESDAELERMEIMRRNNLPGYIGTRLVQVVWVPDWMTHKRQVIGIGQTFAGVCSMLGAWRNRTKPNHVEMAAGKLPSYVFNLPYFFTGVCSFLAGNALIFAPDNEKAYGQYGNWVMGMTAFLPFSLGEKFRQKEPGTAWYTVGKVSFQLQAWAQSLFGGAEVKNGVIIDHDAIRREAAGKAAEIRAEKQHRKLLNHHDAETPTHDSPNTKVSTAMSHSMLVDRSQAPERVGVPG